MKFLILPVLYPAGCTTSPTQTLLYCILLVAFVLTKIMLSIKLPEDTFRPHVSLERPENALKMKPSEARALFRTNSYTGFTSGFCGGHTQFNILIISSDVADDFETFCNQNSGSLPVLYRSKLGEVGAPPLALDSNVR